MASQRQREFFRELINDRQFPSGLDSSMLTTKFDGLSQDAASKWIEKALELPKRDSSEGDNTPPPF